LSGELDLRSRGRERRPLEIGRGLSKRSGSLVGMPQSEERPAGDSAHRRSDKDEGLAGELNRKRRWEVIQLAPRPGGAKLIGPRPEGAERQRPKSPGREKRGRGQ
jgi:hypothetical protein